MGEAENEYWESEKTMQIKDRYGNIREGTGKEFWTELNYIKMHGFKSKPVAHAAEDHSLIAAQAMARKDLGPGFLKDFFPDSKSPEQKTVDPVQVRNPSVSNQATGKFTLADAQRKAREDGIKLPGGQLTYSEAYAKYGPPQAKVKAQVTVQAPAQVQARTVVQVPRSEAVAHAKKHLAASPQLLTVLQRVNKYPGLKSQYFTDPYWHPFLVAAQDLNPVR
jgi:hypothetical protein